MDPSGSNLVYADYIGGSSDDYGAALVLDSADNVYVTGSTASADFPVVKAYQSQQPGPYSGFLTKVSADGSSLMYSTYLGGNTTDVPMSVAIDSLNEVHVAGYTLSSNFPTANAYQSTGSANQGGVSSVYGFLTKFSADGSLLVYSTYFGGNDTVVQNCGTPCYPMAVNAISGVAVDANGNAYVTGSTNASNFPVTSGAYQTSNTTQQAATLGFVSKFGTGAISNIPLISMEQAETRLDRQRSPWMVRALRISRASRIAMARSRLLQPASATLEPWVSAAAMRS